MNFLVDGLVTIGNRVGYIEDIIEDVYLVTFYDDDFNESRDDYGYYLEEELDFDLMVLAKKLREKAKKKV